MSRHPSRRSRLSLARGERETVGASGRYCRLRAGSTWLSIVIYLLLNSLRNAHPGSPDIPGCITVVPSRLSPPGVAMSLSRRDFVGRGALASAGLLLFGCSDALRTTPAEPGAPNAVGYGPLVADPAKRLALPQGFSYTVVTEAGKTTLDSGEPTPRNHDGTGAFAGSSGGTILVNNHEIGDPWGTTLPVPHLDGLV